MILILILLGLIFFPSATKKGLSGFFSLLGQVLYPFTIGLFKAILFLVKGFFQLLWEFIQWIGRGCISVFDASRRRS